jgi:hypothetical protein
MIEIPILDSRAQELVVQFGNTKYRLRLKYNERSSIWTMDIINETTKVALIHGLALVLGQSLLDPYNFNIGNMLVVDNVAKNVDADYQGFNNNCSLVWVTDTELAA